MKLTKRLKLTIKKYCNNKTKKNPKAVFFYPHTNCQLDGYDILNGESDNVLCLFNDMIRDEKYKDYQFFILYYHANRLQSYKDYCKDYNPKRIHFVYFNDYKAIRIAIYQCYTVFTDSDYTRIDYRSKNQRIVCLNYFGGLIKNEFHRWERHGGYQKMLQEQKAMHELYDFHLSISDICSKFIALDNCHYYSNFLSLGFPRNDILFKDYSELRSQIEKLVGFKFEHLITYVPTHRDYENPAREFYDSSKATIRSIWGYVTPEELDSLEDILAETNTLIIAKVHPIQDAQTSVISKDARKHIFFYKDLAQNIKTSLNPLLSISDSIITDYTTTVYDYLYLDRPIIYYFYDLEKYRATRGFFIEPIETVCAGHITYKIAELQQAIKDIAQGQDPEKQKRRFLRELFIKDIDANSTQRIKNHFFPTK
ncbi:MAG: CDP-glycerol glycerophosphotransferase family protein [Fibrobacter sp.]|nr:CDP-glycerol glycerophosphotransferase family protein [Fibrobacter sp.]